MKTIFLRALKGEDKAATLRAAVGTPEAAGGKQRFEIDPKIFASVPGSPFCYWVGDRLRSVFSEFPPIERGHRAARAGGQTSDDVRYLRTYWEIGQHSRPSNWHTYLKGWQSHEVLRRSGAGCTMGCPPIDVSRISWSSWQSKRETLEL
jgi:hypothetical protein